MKQRTDESAMGHPVLFASANSGNGFVSFYERVFDRPHIKRRYIIKGGPGTGKSSFMRSVAADAERRGMVVEYYRCSSDPDSLDGIILDGRIAMMDGTSPHCVEPKVAGARDEMINLGEFWDGDALAERYNDVVSFQALKENCYRKAYRFLSAALSVRENNVELIRPLIRWEKMRQAARRQLRALPSGGGFELLPALRSSIGMKGSVRLDTYEREARRLFAVDDFYGTGSQFLLCLIEEAQKKACAVRVSYDPLCLTLPDAVFFEESGWCFLLGTQGAREPDGRVNMKRFVDAERLRSVKVDYRVNFRMSEALLESAEEALAEAGEYHMELENIYGACMDFEALNKFVYSFCQKIQ